MRKIAFAALLSLAAVTAGAQTLSDALTYSENNYYGTARSIALGNAVTALGGDLGTIGINPAGSAVAPYSQFTFSPGLALLGNKAGYSVAESMDYEGWNTTDRTKLIVPNFASSMKFDTGSSSGVTSFTFAFAANTTSQYMNDFSGSGVNGYTSLLGSFAAGAAGYNPQDLLNRDNYINSSIPWNYLLAYRSGMISEAYDEFGNPILDEAGNHTFIGTTEGMTVNGDGGYDIRTLGRLNQVARVETYGSKTDIIMNAGFNVEDKFYFGFNLGFPVATYNYSEYFRETAVDRSEFPIEYADGAETYFSHATYQYSQTTDLSGVYAKAGVIWLPFDGLRLGAAVQTPTAMTIHDSWCVDGTTSFSESKYYTSESSPLNDYSYSLKTPWRFNAGAAWTFAGRGLVSADLEVVDYKSMKYSSVDFSGDSYFAYENAINRNFGALQYNGRFGVEFRAIPEVAIRAGYTFKTSNQCFRYDRYGDECYAGDFIYYYDDFESGRNWLEGRKSLADVVNSYSLGFGYSSEGSFFADVAFRLTSYPTEYYSPYSDYITGGSDYLPEVASTRNVTDMVLTLGWRF
ncbi:MAG: hypothetical protein Q4G10_05720 [Bacteroidia bacterium]|nr:hypothetical protein [Bacteroidia bacterium]